MGLMYNIWYKHLKDQNEIDDFKKYVQHCRPLLERQRELIAELEKSVDNSETSLDTYSSPNWDYRQADINGFRRCLKFFKNLTDLDLKEHK